MTRKRMIKLLMSYGVPRNDAVWAASLCDGTFSHAKFLASFLEEIFLSCRSQQNMRLIEGDMTGAVAGMVGSLYG